MVQEKLDMEKLDLSPLKRPCGYWKRNGPQRLMCLNAWPIDSVTIRRCGLLGGSVVIGVFAYQAGEVAHQQRIEEMDTYPLSSIHV